jgi:hypothetical protein
MMSDKYSLVDDRPVFIIGTGRSGSTIMKRSLGEHSGVRIFDYELQLWADPAVKRGIWTLLVESTKWDEEEKLDNLRSYLLSRYSISSKGKSYSMRWISRLDYELAVDGLVKSVELYDVASPEAVKKFFKTVYRNLGASARIIDDAPINGLIIPQIQKVYPEAKFIHMIRDGVGVSSSMLKLGWETSFETCAQRWASVLAKTRRIGSACGGDNYKEVFLEDLSERPEYVMDDVCQFLGLSYENDIISHIDVDKAGHKKYGIINDYARSYVDMLYKVN